MTRDQRTRADSYIEAGNYQEGIAIYRRLLAEHPGDDSLVMSLAWAYEDSGDRDGALACLERLLEKELTGKVFTGFAFDELVRIYRAASLHEKLCALCERVVAAYPGDVLLLTTLGDACLRAEKSGRAIEVFEMLTGMEADNPAHWSSLGTARIAAGHVREGIAAYERAATIDPEASHTFFGKLGQALLRFGYLPEAEAALKKAVDIDSGNPSAHCSLGDILIRQGRVGDGAASYERAIGLDPAASGSYYNRLGMTLMNHGYHREAAEAFSKARAAEPENPFYSIRLSDSLRKAGRDDETDDPCG